MPVLPIGGKEITMTGIPSRMVVPNMPGLNLLSDALVRRPASLEPISFGIVAVSGTATTYKFQLYSLEAPPKLIGAVYSFGRRSPLTGTLLSPVDAYVLDYVGITERAVCDRVNRSHDQYEAASRRGATTLLVLPETCEHRRAIIESDLIAKHAPLLNKASGSFGQLFSR
jgi:hypothetical protein